MKKRGTNCSPLSSRWRRISRCDSSTAVFASVAASMSFAMIACVSFAHSLFGREVLRRTPNNICTLIRQDSREGAGDAKVCYLQARIRCDDHIVRLDIAMH